VETYIGDLWNGGCDNRGPEVLKLEQVPVLQPQKGQVLIRNKVFGLISSELFTQKVTHLM
jgi:hypothetical protein